MKTFWMIPSNWKVVVGFLFLGFCFSFLVYSFREAVGSIPSKGHVDRSYHRINEGGTACFSPHSQWSQLKKYYVSSVEDALSLGGTDPKFIVAHGLGSTKSLWKPQLPVLPGHTAMAQNEVLFFHLDCLLHVHKTPPATVYLLDVNQLLQATRSRSYSLLQERNAEWRTWKEVGLVHGVSQLLWPDVRHVNVFGEKILKWGAQVAKFLGGSSDSFIRFLGGSSASIREYSSRDMLDYITGNWDRRHNQFYIYDKKRKSAELIFLDHNHLKLDKNEIPPFELNYCKFWKNDIDNLKALLALGIQQKVLQSIEEHEDDFIWFAFQQNPFHGIESRSREYIEHVSYCIQKYGSTYVFED